MPETYNDPAMEPDLIGQEKKLKLLPASPPRLPQWSLTSSVRKSWARLRQLGRDLGPAMEPDLIGQEKVWDKATVGATASPQWSLTSSVRKSRQNGPGPNPVKPPRNGA